ncbi:hypothetical protein BC938DRAFT_480458 [Jimgerdemannia flammicorona]|uniref:Uncharacterized protein n=1 Tax=Jimgerdemannia flammicorona TaxID=994334 RepID=A0A433QIN6_9FUNG|nr:hypothetical protein BC938DRAFT_480458 [Jimgerdemannia flammicorona]
MAEQDLKTALETIISENTDLSIKARDWLSKLHILTQSFNSEQSWNSARTSEERHKTRTMRAIVSEQEVKLRIQEQHTIHVMSNIAIEHNVASDSLRKVAENSGTKRSLDTIEECCCGLRSSEDDKGMTYDDTLHVHEEVELETSKTSIQVNDTISLKWEFDSPVPSWLTKAAKLRSNTAQSEAATKALCWRIIDVSDPAIVSEFSSSEFEELNAVFASALNNGNPKEDLMLVETLPESYLQMLGKLDSNQLKSIGNLVKIEGIRGALREAQKLEFSMCERAGSKADNKAKIDSDTLKLQKTLRDMHKALLKDISAVGSGAVTKPVPNAFTKLIMPGFVSSFFFIRAILVVYVGAGFYTSRQMAEFNIPTTYDQLEGLIDVARAMLRAKVVTFRIFLGSSIRNNTHPCSLSLNRTSCLTLFRGSKQ